MLGDASYQARDEASYQASYEGGWDAFGRWQDVGLGALAALSLSLGCIAYAVSAAIEFEVLDELLPTDEAFGINPALIWATSFAVGKILATLYIAALAGRALYLGSQIMRACLVAWSLVCSLLVIGMALDNPNLDELVAGETVRVNGEFDRQFAALRDQQATATAQLGASFDRSLAQELAPLDERIAQARRDIAIEKRIRDANGNPFGPRYRRYEADLHKGTDERARAIGRALKRRASAEQRLAAQHSRELDGLQEKHRGALQAVSHEQLSANPRAQSGLLGFSHLVSQEFSWRFSPLMLGMLMTVLIAVAIEAMCIVSITAAVGSLARAEAPAVQ